MDSKCLSLLCDPDSHASLVLAEDALLNPESGMRYPIRDGVPVFLQEVTGQNCKYQKMYDRLAPGYDVAERLYRWFAGLGGLRRRPDFRLEFIRELEIAPAARVLEVSVGTGANLRYFHPDVEFYGLDLSWGMLRRCQRNLRKWPGSGELFQGEAEHLPFLDAGFDCVFHVGGINFFNDKARAIEEMIRVAKPGTKIVIVDETEKVVRGDYRKNPFTRKYYQGGESEAEAYCPIGLVPDAMREIQSRQIASGKLYCLTFRKP